MPPTLVEKSTLRKLVPANSLNAENFQELAGKAFEEDAPPGRTLFKSGDTDRKAVYVLEGEVVVRDDDGQSETVVGGTPRSRHALAPGAPRRATAVTRSHCKLCRFDSDLLDILLTWDQLSGIEVNEITVQELESTEDGDVDWMTRILQSQAFHKIPPANIQAMFMKMSEEPVRAGETVIRQGDDGDYYYIIKSGQAKVMRTAKTGSQLTLATLKAGDAFGEEALLSEAKRNATIEMETDGVLMRLSKQDFNELLREPMLKWISREQADDLVTNKGGQFLDVRLESEFENQSLPGALNIPLFMLRMRVETLNPDKPYIIYCDTGRRSSAAAFLLSERGFPVYVLKGGIAGEADAA